MSTALLYQFFIDVAGDSTPPEVTSLLIEGNQLTVAFSEAVSGDLTGLTLTASGGALTITGDDTLTAQASLTVQLSRAPADYETITADYSDVTGTITDAATNELASFSDAPVTIQADSGSNLTTRFAP